MHRERVQAALKAAAEIDGGPREAARQIGVPANTFYQWTSRRSVPVTHLGALCKLLKLSADYLLGLTDDPSGKVEKVYVTDPPESWDKFCRLPVAKERVAAGFPVLVNPPEPEPGSGKRRPLEYAFRTSFLRQLTTPDFSLEKPSDKARFKLHVVAEGDMGESMKPTIQPGALLLVDCGPGGLGPANLDAINQGAVHVVSPVGIPGMAESDAGLTAKRLYVSEGRLVLVSDNPEYSPVTFAPTDEVRLQQIVVGEVVWVGQRLEPPKRRLVRRSKAK